MKKGPNYRLEPRKTADPLARETEKNAKNSIELVIICLEW
jgi:hypothetical protein